MVFIWHFLPSFSSPCKVRNGQLFLGLPDLTIIQNQHAQCAKSACCGSANPHAHIVWKPLCSGACQVQATVPISLLVQKSWLTLNSSLGTMTCTCQVPLLHECFSHYPNWILCETTRTQKKESEHTHSLSLSLSLSLSVSLSPSLEDQQEVQTKLLPANCNPIIISLCFLRKTVLH
jgi:hypothetical protein